jgi:putative hydrolase of the HAD superfamily
MGSMVSAVIFDFYGTLAHWATHDGWNYQDVFSAHGYGLETAVLQDYFVRYDGVDHAEHSVSEEAYEVWVHGRLRELTDAAGVSDPAHVAAIIDGLRASDRGPMIAYPDAAPTLQYLRDAGLAIGVCSNWGWELDAYLDQVGLLHLIDASVTSARAGSRKPHPGIYAKSAESLDVDPGEVVFVGDSWEPDVRGPRRAGMAAVHVWREWHSDERAPALQPGDQRVEELSGVLALLGVGVS